MRPSNQALSLSLPATFNIDALIVSRLVSAKIGFFYSVFYGVLAALVAVCMLVFLRTLDPRIPKWQLHESLIGTNPGKTSRTKYESFRYLYKWLTLVSSLTS